MTRRIAEHLTSRRSNAGFLPVYAGMAILLCCRLSSAQSLSVDPPDKQLEISGRLQDAKTTFDAYVRLTASEQLERLLLMPSDLKLETDGTTMVSRNDISIPAGTSLAAMQPTDIKVTIRNVPQPGTYTGVLGFVAAGQNAAILELTVTLRVLPQWDGLVIRAETDAPRLNITGRLLAAQETFRGIIRLSANRDIGELTMLRTGLTHKDDSSIVIDASNVGLATGISLKRDVPRDIQISVSNVQRAGDYEGELRFLANGQSEKDALTVPLSLKVLREYENVKLTSERDGQTLKLHGLVSGDASSIGVNVRLMARGRDVSDLVLLPSDLNHTELPEFMIARNNITSAAATLKHGQPRDMKITIANIKRPGKYQGELKFVLPGEDVNSPEDVKVSFNLELDAKEKPSVVPDKDSLSIQLVRCSNSADCRLTGAILGQAYVAHQQPIYLHNATRQPVMVAPVFVELLGEKSGRIVKSQVQWPKAELLAAGETKSLALTITVDELPADKYQGVARFSLDGHTDNQVKVNLDLQVRYGPLIPLILLVIGIQVGRVVQGMEAPVAKMQDKLFKRLFQLKSRTRAEITNSKALAFLRQEAENLRVRINRARETEQVLSNAADKLETRIDDLRDLQQLENRCQGKQELLDKIDLAIDAVTNDRTEEFEKLCNEIKDALNQNRDEAAEALLAIPMFRPDRKTIKDLEDEAKGFREPGGNYFQWLAKILAYSSGAYFQQAEFRFWFLAPLCYVLLLFLLALIGLQTLYVSQPTFGANLVYDYLGLFIWGISAEVAKRTLQNVAKKT